MIDEIVQLFEKEERVPVPDEVALLPFGEAVWPWIEIGCQKLTALASSSLKNLEPKAYFSLQKQLAQQLSKCSAPSMTMEMHVSSLQEGLEGDDPQARYHFFVQEKLSKCESLRAFFEEYQELACIVKNCLEFWVEQTAEFLHRLESDFLLLEKTFGSLGTVADIQVGLGDLHNKGRSVSIVQFSSGLSLVYKPKNLQISSAFQTLLEELNTLGLPCKLQSYRIVCRDCYGWEEVVTHQPCKEREEVDNFFKRNGMLLCLLYVLKGTDVHYQNIIASGEFPMLIDLETLFSSRVSGETEQNEEVQKKFEYSVISTSLLPRWHFAVEGRGRIDFSGLSGDSEQIFPYPLPVWNHLNTDQMTREFALVKLENQIETHLCIFQGSAISASDHLDTLIEGFQLMHGFLREHRDALIRETQLSKMGQFPVRIVLRSTRFYFHILQSLYAPQAILNINITEKVLDLLSQNQTWLPSKIVEEEKRALLRGDIPYFYSFPISRDLYIKGEDPVSDCLRSAAFDEVILRLNELDIHDCNLQVAYIRSSFEALKCVHADHEEKKARDMNVPQSILNKKQLLTVAEEIGTEILGRALRKEDRSLTWIVLEPALELERNLLQPISDVFSSGRTGIALFFAALYSFTGAQQWKEAALDTLKELKTLPFKNLNAAPKAVGMAGVGGIVYALSHTAKLLQDPSLLTVAQNILQSIDVKQDRSYDLFLGNAGLILALLAIENMGLSVLSLAKECGEQLLLSAVDMQQGALAWKPAEYSVPLLGMSHGTAGIAYALLKLGKKTGDSRFVKCAEKAIRYERFHFSEELGGWPNFQEKTYPVRWCHGAVGIGMARIACSKIHSDEKYRDEIRAAVNLTKEVSKKTTFYHLCCGLCGNVEFLTQAHDYHPDPILQTLVSQMTSQIAHRLAGDLHNQIKIGFMYGLAGIGYTLLRSIDRDKIPQVLLLE